MNAPMTHALDEADLALIETNTSSHVVQRLILEVRRLQDELACAQAQIADLYLDCDVPCSS